MKTGDLVIWTKCEEGCCVCEKSSIDNWYRNIPDGSSLRIVEGPIDLATPFLVGYVYKVELVTSINLDVFHVDDGFEPDSPQVYVYIRHLKLHLKKA
jgi:hypothetical protein